MKVEEIKTLAKIMRDDELSCIEITEGDNKIRIEKNLSAAVNFTAPAQNNTSAAMQNSGACKPAETSGYKEIKCPMVGVFYSAPSPESDPYVKIGSFVKKGDILCVIEAMKLLNELNSDIDGEIAEVCVENGQVVEYGQTLFKLR